MRNNAKSMTHDKGEMRRMSKAMSILFTLILACFMALGCREHHLEKDFFDKSPGDRVERLRQYSLDDQYKIFRYGNDHIEPPTMSLAPPTAERGASAVPFLVDQLKATTDDIAVRDIVLIFETMEDSGSYNVKADTALMRVLGSKVSGMKDRDWQAICLKQLQGINETNTVSMLHALQRKFVSDRIASYAMQGATVLVNVMRIPCFGRRMTIGRASIVWPGAS
jgi:hypothetical protein